MLAPLYTAEEMKAAEAGHDVATLMQRAGSAVAEETLRRFPRRAHVRRFTPARARTAATGRSPRASSRSEACAGSKATTRADLVIDALLGTGIRGAPREETAREIERINASPAPVVAVDIPSGVDASTGEVAGAAVRADLTVTMHGPKVGLAVGPGCFLAGEIVVADIGLEPGETEHRLVLRDVVSLVPRKRPEDNKYSAGSVLVVGGARGTTGAAALAARAAFRADAGYVAIAAPAEVLPTLETLVLEAVKRPLEEALAAAERASALALGPGLGREQKTLVRRLLEETDVPAVVDADALHELEPFERSAPTVLTPHSGELVAPARRRVGVGRRAPARSGAARGRALRLRRAAQGRRHADRRARRGHVGRARRRPFARDGGQRRRPHGDRRRVSREGDGRARGSRGRRRRAATRSSRRAGARADRKRRDRSTARVSRSELTIDLGALRRNVATLRRALDGAELWAVVKADGYGHGAVDVSRAALEAGASALCVVTAAEALELRGALPDARILCMGPLEPNEVAVARDASVEVAVAGGRIPEGVRVHLKLDTGMGRFG